MDLNKYGTGILWFTIFCLGYYFLPQDGILISDVFSDKKEPEPNSRLK